MFKSHHDRTHSFYSISFLPFFEISIRVYKRYIPMITPNPDTYVPISFGVSRYCYLSLSFLHI